MRLDTSHKFTSSKNNIYLIADELEELNHGIMFWKFSFFVGDKKIHHDFLNCEKEGLFVNLKEFTFESNDGVYLYIPKQNPVVYNTLKKEFLEVKSPIESTNNDFLKNYFIDDSTLLILHQRAFYIVDLKNGRTHFVQYPYNELLFKDIFKKEQSNTYVATYKDLRDYKEYSKEIKI